MRIERNKKLYLQIYLLLIALIFLSACRNTVTVTREYIYNSAWENGEYQGFKIAKIKLLDSTISVFKDNFNRFSLADHIIDSSFCFYHYTGNENYNSKSFFNQISNNLHWRKCNNLIDERKTIGLLELNTWYIFEGLNGTVNFYTYIDKEGNSHTYSLGPTNW